MLNNFNPVPKPAKRKKKVPNTKITQKAREEVYRRSAHACERCGKTRAYAFEVSHLVQASQGGSGNDVTNLALLCGPSVNTGTCHWWADSTKEGREWRMKKK